MAPTELSFVARNLQEGFFSVIWKLSPYLLVFASRRDVPTGSGTRAGSAPMPGDSE